MPYWARKGEAELKFSLGKYPTAKARREATAAVDEATIAIGTYRFLANHADETPQRAEYLHKYLTALRRKANAIELLHGISNE